MLWLYPFSQLSTRRPRYRRSGAGPTRPTLSSSLPQQHPSAQNTRRQRWKSHEKPGLNVIHDDLLVIMKIAVDICAREIVNSYESRNDGWSDQAEGQRPHPLG